jgi:predicted GH43/DUF377 family glycosyl hydrolase
MKHVLLLILVLLCITPASAQENPVLTLVSDEPVVEHGPTAAWDGVFTDPGAVLYHDGVFHMFRNGFRTWPGEVQIGYLTSRDGITWVEPTADPVLRSADIPFTGLAALASSVVVTDEGQWMLYFYTWDSRSFSGPGVIGRAVAESPLGPWVVDTEPVLPLGSDGSWDDQQVLGPRVVGTESGYVMYYTGYTASRQSAAIGMATSADGLTWVKHNDPTTGGAFADSDPVFITDDPGRSVQHVTPLRTPQGWTLIYRSSQTSRPDATMEVRYALSDDGIAWETPASNTLLGSRDMPGGRGYWWMAGTYVEDTYFLFIESGSMGGTDIYLTTYAGTLGID